MAYTQSIHHQGTVLADCAAANQVEPKQSSPANPVSSPLKSSYIGCCGLFRLPVPRFCLGWLNRNKPQVDPKVIRKVILVGPRSCGKTSLALRLFGDPYHDDGCAHPPTAKTYVVERVVDGKKVMFHILDTGSGEGFRCDSFGTFDPDLCLLCFAVDEPGSLDTTGEKCKTELSRFYPNVPVIVVGCKKDLRSDPVNQGSMQQRIVTHVQGTTRAGAIGAEAYLECSSRDGTGIEDLLRSVLGSRMEDTVIP